MCKEIKKYLTFVLLFLFLFPMVEKELHALEHSADKHCIANEKHFHELEHHCDICDLNITTPFTLSNFDNRAPFRFSEKLIFCSHTAIFISSPANSFLPRGPPYFS